MVIPKSAIGAISGLYYKIGSHGFAFMFLKGEWIKSARTADEVVNFLATAEHPFALDNEIVRERMARSAFRSNMQSHLPGAAA